MSTVIINVNIVASQQLRRCHTWHRREPFAIPGSKAIILLHTSFTHPCSYSVSHCPRVV